MDCLFGRDFAVGYHGVDFLLDERRATGGIGDVQHRADGFVNGGDFPLREVGAPAHRTHAEGKGNEKSKHGGEFLSFRGHKKNPFCFELETENGDRQRLVIAPVRRSVFGGFGFDRTYRRAVIALERGFVVRLVEFAVDDILSTPGGHPKNNRPGDCGGEPHDFHFAPSFFLRQTAHSQGEHHADQPKSWQTFPKRRA